MRKRRRNTATWFPVNPTFFQEGGPALVPFETTFNFPANVSVGDTQIFPYPLTLDGTPSVSLQDDGSSLRDYVEGQDYLLQRVVGKVWAGIDFTADSDDGVTEALACVALAVLPNQSGTQGPDLDPEEYNPFWAQNAQQPWIWRRTWRLSNPNSNAYDSTTQVSVWTPEVTWPARTSGYTGLHEGGHLDSKVKRRITKEHRLYIIAGLMALNESGSESTSTAWSFGYDLRILGSMRRGRNPSSF